MISCDDGSIICLFEIEYGVEEFDGSVLCTYSYDDGISWTQPIDISSITRKYERDALGTGPGHGIQSSDGRIIVPTWFVPKGAGADLRSGNPNLVTTLVSDDYGKTWEMGEYIPPNRDHAGNPNESCIVELSNGSFMMNSRTGRDNSYRALSYSDDGGSGWGEFRLCEFLIDPDCYGCMTNYDKEIIYIGCRKDDGRRNLTAMFSEDNGYSWTEGRMIDKKGGYSDISTMKSKNFESNILILHEEYNGNRITKHIKAFDSYSIYLTRCDIEYLRNHN